MKIAITSRGESLDSEMDPRFGRCQYFIILDDGDVQNFKAIKNDAAMSGGGAGIQAAQNIAQHQPDAVLTGNCGPKAFKVLQAAGVEVAVGVKGKVKDAVQGFLEGKYQPVKEANVEGHWV